MKKTGVYIVLLVLFHLLHATGAVAVAVFDVVKLGAKPDGKTDSTRAFVNAWTGACAAVGSARINVPSGTYLVKNVAFNGPCRNTDISFHIDGTIVAPADYNALGKSDHWFSFKDVTGVSVYGGTLDGRGAALWACKRDHGKCPGGATTLALTNSKKIRINGVKSLNSQMFHIVINGCENVYMRDLKITASGQSPNTDGIHVQLSTGVTIMNSAIKTGDDCISIGPGARNLWIQEIACGPGHGISIGSLGKSFNEQGVQNVTVKTSTFTGTQNGLRIKTWGRPSKGFVRDVLFQDSVMQDVKNPLVIDQNYCPHGRCPKEGSGVKISKVTYSDIHGSSATEVAVKFDCSTTNPCQDIKLEDVRLTYRGKPAASDCANADGSVDGVVQPVGCLN